MASKERLYELWMLYYAKKDLTYLQQWLETFVTTFEKIIDISCFEPRRPEDSASEIPVLPRDVLQVLSQQLNQCVNCLSTSEAEAGLGQPLLFVKFLIIICRNLENIEADRTPVFIHEIIRLLSHCITRLKNPSLKNNIPTASQLENIALYSLHLCECLFDPYQTWRRQSTGEVVSAQEKNKYKFAPAALPQDFCTFFQESFKDSQCLPEILKLRLVHTYGAIITGSKRNALLAITPSSLEVLMLVLRSWCYTGYHDHKDLKLLQLTLKCLIEMIHILHASSMDQWMVEIQTILETYFRVLNADQPMTTLKGDSKSHMEAGLITLKISMLNAIPEMLNCGDKPVLQIIFLNNNCFEHILRLVQNSKGVLVQWMVVRLSSAESPAC